MHGAYMLDADVDFQGLRTDRTFLRLVYAVRALPANRLLRRGERFVRGRPDQLPLQRLLERLQRVVRAGARVLPRRAPAATSTRTRPGASEDGFRRSTRPVPAREPVRDSARTRSTRASALFAYVDSRDSMTGPRSGGVVRSGTASTGTSDRKSSRSGRPSSSRSKYCRTSTEAACSRSRCRRAVVPKGGRRGAALPAADARRQRRAARLRAVPIPGRPLVRPDAPNTGGMRSACWTWRCSSTRARSCRSSATSTPRASTTAAASASGSGCARPSSAGSTWRDRRGLPDRSGPSATSSTPNV